jgi:Zn-dependent peptidase ImmA (M78 family)
MHNKRDIDNIVYDILKRSKSLDVFPTPVDQIVQFCELNLGNSDYFHKIPKNYLAKNIDVFNRMLNKVFGILDREIKHIYIDPKLPGVKQTFLKLHETGHHCLPWQSHICYFDNKLTLTHEVQETFEAEANFFASSALFQLDRFDEEMKKLPLEIGSPMSLAERFGSSKHAALRRYAENSKKKCALLVLEKKSGDRESLSLRNSFQSQSFTLNFGNISFPEILGKEFPFVVY